MANISGALMKLGGGALQQGSKKAIEKVANKAIEEVATKAATKALTNTATRGLTGAGISSLSKMAGSTLDGILGPSSSIILPNAEKPVAINLAEKYADSPLAKTAQQELAEAAARNNQIIKDLAGDPDNMWFSDIELKGSKVKDLYPGAANNMIGTNPEAMIPADYPEINKMIKEGKLKTAHGTDKFGSGARTTRNYELTGEPLTYEEKQGLLRGIKDQLSDETAGDVTLEPEDFVSKDQLRLIDQETSGTPRKIAVDEIPTRKKNVKVSRPVANMGVDDAVTKTTNPVLSDEIASLKEKIGSASGNGGGNMGGGTTTEMPGTEGFNVKLKTGDTTNVKIGTGATGSTRQQRAVRKLDDMTAKSMNASSKQYKGLVGKSGSIDSHYKTVAERIRAEKIDQANVADKAQAALSLREDIKQQGLQYAEANGVTIDLAGIDNTIGLSATQKRKLAELGLGLDNMVGGSGVVTPTQAEEIYKTLRDYAYNWSDSKDALTKVAGNACEKEAEAVRDLIDNTMDNINVDYKTPLVEGAAANGEDPAYLRKVAAKKDFKFSDLRKDQADWININDLAGNKLVEEPTINLFGTDTGINNPLSAGAEKIKEKFYERQANGSGAGGFGGGGGVPPVGGTGAENNINFETVGGRSGTLGNLLGKAKNAGLVGAGILGGMMLGGGGGGTSDYSGMTDTDYTTEPSVDPYKQLTIYGYNYEQLEEGYSKALMAGDTEAAKLIGSMIELLDNKIQRYKDSQGTSGGVASKQKAALNVLSGLMGNYQSQGPIGGRFTQFMNAITGGGYNPGIAAYDTGAAGSLGTIIKALGDTGALSEGDQRRALELLPKTTDSEAAAKAKYQQLVMILKGAGAQ